MSRIRFIAVVILSLTALHVVAVGQHSGAGQKKEPPPPDYYPLRVGDWWKYQSTTGEGKQSEFTMTVLADEKQANGTVLHQVEIKSTMPIHEWYSKGNGWVLWHKEAYASNNMNVTFEPVRQFLKNPPTPGSSWSWKGKGMMSVDIDESNQAAASEMVEVPAGKFEAIKVVTNVTQGGQSVTKTYWYANWVGLVKSITESPSYKSTTVLMDYSFKPKR